MEGYLREFCFQSDTAQIRFDSTRGLLGLMAHVRSAASYRGAIVQPLADHGPAVQRTEASGEYASQTDCDLDALVQFDFACSRYYSDVR